MTVFHRGVVLLLVLAGAVVEAAVTAQIPPSPAVTTWARANGFPLEGIELASTREAARPGDRLIVLFTIEEGETSRQWLAEFKAAALTEREVKSKPGSGMGLLSIFQSSLKTDTGHEFSFPQDPSALEVRTFGPFGAESAAAARIRLRQGYAGQDGVRALPLDDAGVSARVLATRDYLVHGLSPMAEIELRLRAAGKKYPDLSFLFRPRFSEEQMTAAKARAQAAGFTEDDERAYAEGYFALVQFANLAFKTPGVAPVTRELLDSPTLFSGAFVNLDWSALQLENGADWGMTAARVFRVPYSFSSKSNAKGTLYLTPPLPPVQIMAGIVGLTIDWSSKISTKRLIVRVLAGRRGTPEPTKPSPSSP